MPPPTRAPTGPPGAPFRFPAPSSPGSASGHPPVPVEPRVEQRFHAVAIPRQHQTPGARIVDGEREDAAQAGDQVLAPLLVQVDEPLRIGRAAKAMPADLELPPQLLVVVDLPVVH